MKRYIRSAAQMILGMSKSRRDLEAWIEDQTLPTMIAIAQLYVFPNGARTHWRREVWEKFHTMHLLRHNKQLPSANFILKSGWEVNNRDKQLRDVVRFVIGKEDAYSPRKDIDINELTYLMEEYFEWLAWRLSKSQLIEPDEVYSELDRLGLREHL